MNQEPTADPYQILGLTRAATEAEIKQAYFTMVREHSPERDPAGFKRIRAAYDQLRVSGARIVTDLLLVNDEPQTFVSRRLTDAENAATLFTPATILSDLLALEAYYLLLEVEAQSG